MTVASRVARARKPPGFVVLPPSAFADTWDGKPQSDVAVGVRLLSQQEIDVAAREAEKESLGFYAELRGTPVPTDREEVERVYNAALILNAVAHIACDPNDASKPYVDYAEDRIRQILTPEGAQRIWDQYLIVKNGSGFARPQADDEEIDRLGRILVSGPELDAESRKLCAYLLDKLADADEADGEDVYVTKAW